MVEPGSLLYGNENVDVSKIDLNGVPSGLVSVLHPSREAVPIKPERVEEQALTTLCDLELGHYTLEPGDECQRSTIEPVFRGLRVSF